MLKMNLNAQITALQKTPNRVVLNKIEWADCENGNLFMILTEKFVF